MSCKTTTYGPCRPTAHMLVSCYARMAARLPSAGLRPRFRKTPTAFRKPLHGVEMDWNFPLNDIINSGTTSLKSP